MLVRHVTICVAMLLGAATLEVTSAHALSMQECSAKYKAAKEAGTLNGMKWNDFRKAQCGAEGAAPPPAAETKPPPAPPPPPAVTAAPAEKAGSPGKQAFLARLHACSAEWKAAKAAGTRPAGMHWPQFWSACDKRKKAQGM